MGLGLLRTKSVDTILKEADEGEVKLSRSLTAFDLTMLGIGAIIGAGIFAITGTAAATRAGPGIVVSFVLCAVGCGFAGLCYAELAAMIPIAGSAYTYSYATLGEIFGWIIGWDLILEYAVGAITVAIAWSGYFQKFLEGFDIHLPAALSHGCIVPVTDANGVVVSHTFQAAINVPAVLLVLAITALLVVGVKESARVTGLIVVLKVAIVILFIIIGVRWVKPANWHPFLPFGVKGIFGGAGVVFFAYIGFDAITTTAEEAKNPKRDLPIGILGSLAICTVLYILVSGILTGMVSYKELNNAAPVAYALSAVGIKWGAVLVSLGAVLGLGSVVLVMMMGQPRVFFSMSRDGLLPSWISKVHPKYQTPYRSTLITGVFVCLFAGTLSIDIAGELTSIGTLFAFILVCGGVIALRIRRPDLPRPFRAPAAPVVGVLGGLTCLSMTIYLGVPTWIRFIVWLAIGLVIYFAYSRKHSTLGRAQASAAPIQRVNP
jgi:APA family basic amino acid/polyamine antiporter